MIILEYNTINNNLEKKTIKTQEWKRARVPLSKAIIIYIKY